MRNLIRKCLLWTAAFLLLVALGRIPNFTGEKVIVLKSGQLIRGKPDAIEVDVGVAKIAILVSEIMFVLPALMVRDEVLNQSPNATGDCLRGN